MIRVRFFVLYRRYYAGLYWARNHRKNVLLSFKRTGWDAGLKVEVGW